MDFVDGQITEIIYKGTHDHPQPSRRYSSGNIMSGQEERSDKVSYLNGGDDKEKNYTFSFICLVQ